MKKIRKLLLYHIFISKKDRNLWKNAIHDYLKIYEEVNSIWSQFKEINDVKVKELLYKDVMDKMVMLLIDNKMNRGLCYYVNCKLHKFYYTDLLNDVIESVEPNDNGYISNISDYYFDAYRFSHYYIEIERKVDLALKEIFEKRIGLIKEYDKNIINFIRTSIRIIISYNECKNK